MNLKQYQRKKEIQEMAAEAAKRSVAEIMSDRDCREAFERNECEKYGNNYEDMKKNWDWYESQFGCRYPEDSPRGIVWATWQRAWQHRQTEVDKLQKRIDVALQVFEKGRSGCFDIYDLYSELEQALKDDTHG